jgi:hypothetical protein
MKIGKLFDLVTDSKDLLDLFSGVETTEQMTSRLERLRKERSEQVLECINGLRISTTALLDDALEMNASLDDDTDVDGDLDAELAKLESELEDDSEDDDVGDAVAESENPASVSQAEIAKTTTPSSG